MTTQTTPRSLRKYAQGYMPTESRDFYEGRMSEIDLLEKQIKYDLEALLSKEIPEDGYSSHQRKLNIAGRKHAYDAILNTLISHRNECRKRINLIAERDA